MSYLVLARKWRPRTFADITGQEHVTRTLTHAIEQDRVHHAFLFCGARGVGKTSAARVLGAALNCDHGPTTTPCGECRACREIAAGQAIDFFEIDGASNRGISEIRELREGVGYAPQRDRFKIYVIDEVHMLTMEAFNALLKTLEEPPPHAKFLFATTEPHRVPTTILSRCQRFDFKRIPLETIVERLRGILEAEGLRLTEDAIHLVARQAEGSMRDALSLLDRVASFADEELDYDRVVDLLGVADRGRLLRFLDAVLAGDAARALGLVGEVFDHGTDPKQFAGDLVRTLRDVVVLRVAGREAELVDLPAEEAARLEELGARREVEDFERLFRMAGRTAERLGSASFPRLELEMAAVRMCRLRSLQPVDRVIERIAAIERHLDTGEPLPPTDLGRGGQGGAGGGTAPETGAAGSAGASAQSSEEASDARAAEPAPETPSGAEPEPEPPAPEPEGAAEPTEPEPPAPEPEAAEPEPEAAAEPEPPAPEPEEAAEPEPEPPAPEPEAAEPEPPAPEPEGAAEPEPEPPAPEPPAPEPEGAAEAEPEPPAPEPEAAEPEPEAAAEPEPPAPEPEAGEAEPEPPAPEPEASPERPAEADDATPEVDAAQWERVVEALRQEQPRMAALLERSCVLGAEGGVLRIGFARGDLHAERARKQQASIAELLAPRLGVRDVHLETVDAPGRTPADARAEREHAEAQRRAEERERRRRAIADHPVVRDVMERFGGELAHVAIHEHDEGAGGAEPPSDRPGS